MREVASATGKPDGNKMPKVSGLEVLKTIKTDEHLKNIPVVALTSSRLKSDLKEFYRHGVNAYVVKPVGFSEFVTTIKQLAIFWMAINKPPPVVGRKENGVRDSNPTFPRNEPDANDIHPPSSASER